MNRFLSKVSRTFRRKNVFPVILVVLLLIFGLGTIYVTLFVPKGLGTGTEAVQAESTDKDNVLLVNDIYEGEREIPKFNVAKNEYGMDLFEVKNNQVIYPGAFIGIDVSEHQGEIDWAKVKESGIDFVMIRAGYRGSTRGNIYEDLQFEYNLAGATEAGLKVGVYFFSQAVNVSEAEEEAAFVLSSISEYKDKIEYPIIFDWEPVFAEDGTKDQNARTYSSDGETVSDCAAAFCKKIDKAGYNTGVYLNKSQAYEFYNLDKIGQYDLWYAEYQEKPSLYYNFAMWQYSTNGTLDGVPSEVDVNLSFKDYKK